MAKKELLTPYQDVLPALATDQYTALKRRIDEEGGVHDALLVTEDNELLDGHNRLKIAGMEAVKLKVIPGSAKWTKAHRVAFVIRCNWGRRNLSHDQEKTLDRDRKKIAKKLKQEGESLKQIASIFGVRFQRVSEWLNINNSEPGITNIDCRVKIPVSMHNNIADRVKAGESQNKVAADLRVSQPRITQIVNKEKKREEKDRQRQDSIKRTLPIAAKGEENILLGDFRKLSKSIPDASVRLVYTDPPYGRDAVELYRDLGEVAARVLQPGGSLLCYAGHYLIPIIQPMLSAHLRFWWFCGILHTGKLARMKEYGIIVRWKPILWYVNKTRGDKETFVDDHVTSTQEKDLDEWQQSLVEAEYYIKKLTAPGELVFDPFGGGGTTYVAAKKLNRQWVGCEEKTDKVKLIRARIANTQL